MSAHPVPVTVATRVMGRRVVALLIDGVIFGAFYGALFFLLADRVSAPPVGAVKVYFQAGDVIYAVSGAKGAAFSAIVLVVGFAYYAWLPGRKGFTPGKAMTGIRVVRTDGTLPAGVGRNAIRSLLWIVDAIPYLVPALLGFVVAMTNQARRRIGDLAAGTCVVLKQAAGHPLVAATEAPAVAQSAATAAASTEAQAAPAPPPPQQPAADSTQGAASAPTEAPAQPAAPEAPTSSEAPPVAEPPAAGGPPAGWHPDPWGQARLRYWDGQRWTGHTAP